MSVHNRSCPGHCLTVPVLARWLSIAPRTLVSAVATSKLLSVTLLSRAIVFDTSLDGYNRTYALTS